VVKDVSGALVAAGKSVVFCALSAVTGESGFGCGGLGLVEVSRQMYCSLELFNACL
jgi:hypothetical protein